MREYFVYLMANRSRLLYIGVTNNLLRRVCEHKHKLIEGFTARYNLNQLVYYETFNDVRLAIAREKQLKGWLKWRKYELIESVNPHWRDLAAEWYSEQPIPERSFTPPDDTNNE